MQNRLEMRPSGVRGNGPNIEKMCVQLLINISNIWVWFSSLKNSKHRKVKVKQNSFINCEKNR